MEISTKIINEAFINIKSATKHDKLQVLLEEINSYSIENILHENTDGIKKNSRQIQEIMSSNIASLYSDNETSKQILSSIILTIKMYFDKSIENGDIKSLLIFLSINIYLKIDIYSFINEEVDTTKLSGNIIKTLDNIKLETRLKSGASYYEKELKTKSVEGINEDNIEKIYQYILSVERGGMGFHFNYLLENLILFFIQFDIKLFAQHIDSLNSPETIVFYFQSLSENTLLELSNIYNKNNKWIHFELIRQIIEKEDKDYNPNSKTISLIVKSLNAFYKHNISIYKQTIAFFHRSKVFNSALGYQMKDLKTDEMLDVFSNSIPLNEYDFLLEQRSILLDELSKGISEEVFKKVLNTVFRLWKDLFNTIAENDDSYQGDMLLTDYANFIIQYYNFFEDDEIINVINKLLNKLIWINSEWFKGQSQQLTKFNLYLTEVYLLSYAYKYKKVRSSETIKLFNLFNKNRQYEVTIHKDPLPQIKENINWI